MARDPDLGSEAAAHLGTSVSQMLCAIELIQDILIATATAQTAGLINRTFASVPGYVDLVCFFVGFAAIISGHLLSRQDE